MAKKTDLTDDFERQEKKRIIERLLIEAADDLGSVMPKMVWLPLRRYLQRVLWSMSLPELGRWTTHDSTMLILEVHKRNQARKSQGSTI